MFGYTHLFLAQLLPLALFFFVPVCLSAQLPVCLDGPSPFFPLAPMYVGMPYLPVCVRVCVRVPVSVSLSCMCNFRLCSVCLVLWLISSCMNLTSYSCVLGNMVRRVLSLIRDEHLQDVTERAEVRVYSGGSCPANFDLLDCSPLTLCCFLSLQLSIGPPAEEHPAGESVEGGLSKALRGEKRPLAIFEWLTLSATFPCFPFCSRNLVTPPPPPPPLQYRLSIPPHPVHIIDNACENVSLLLPPCPQSRHALRLVCGISWTLGPPCPT